MADRRPMRQFTVTGELAGKPHVFHFGVEVVDGGRAVCSVLDSSFGRAATPTVISYELPDLARRLLVNTDRDSWWTLYANERTPMVVKVGHLYDALKECVFGTERKKPEFNPDACDRCGAPWRTKSLNEGGGVECSKKCGGWFCY